MPADIKKPDASWNLSKGFHFQDLVDVKGENLNYVDIEQDINAHLVKEDMHGNVIPPAQFVAITKAAGASALTEETQGATEVDDGWAWAPLDCLSSDKKEAWVVDKQEWNGHGAVCDLLSRSFTVKTATAQAVEAAKIANPANPTPTTAKELPWSYDWSSLALRTTFPNGLTGADPNKGRGTFSNIKTIQGLPWPGA
jgi:hypothetical protein